MENPSLYVHIPFCDGRCDYCDFYSETGIDYESRIVYVDLLLEQLKQDMDRYQIEGFRTIYIGGGTPTALGLELLERLVSGIAGTLALPVLEWTVEANPESLDQEIVAMLNESSVDRLSLGLQSLIPRSRSFLGRRGALESTLRALDILEQGWEGRLSLDLIRGLPSNESAELADELEALNLTRVDHLSLYDLSIEAGTPLHSRWPGNDERRYDDLGLLEEYGFSRYEVSSFARSGGESLHNLVYWEIDPYLGIGAGAVGFLPGEGSLRSPWTRMTTAPSLKNYIRNGNPARREQEQPSLNEFFMEHLIMGFRQIRGLSLQRIEERFGATLEEIIPDSASVWLRTGKVLISDGRFSLSRGSFEFQNSLILEAWQELDRRNSFA